MRRLKIFCVFFYSKFIPTLHLLNLRQHTLWKNEKTITLLRFNEKSPFLHQNDCQIILYRLNKIILMRRLKIFLRVFLFKVHPDTSLIEFKTTHFVEEQKTYNFAQIQ